MRKLLLLITLFSGSIAHAQSFPIGNRSITFNDPARNRNIGTQIYYPGATSGSNAAVAQGTFPVLVMGHGFAMGVDAYSNLWNYFSPRGYIVVLPTTEGGLLPAPNHGAFGQDLAFLATAMQAANTDPASPFFGRVAPATALMGHSMGGGASFLGAANNTTIQTLVNFAAAETNPSAISAAANVQVPTLVMAGSDDCVTPINGNQGPMYNALTVPCRAFVTVTGGNHCQFAQNNFNCNFGEQTCNPGSPDISRAAQHSVVNDIAGLWLDHFLKGLPGAFDAFQDSLAVSTRITSQFTCLTTSVAEQAEDGLSLFPIPTADRLVIEGTHAGEQIRVVDMLGRECRNLTATADRTELTVTDLPAGTYRALLVHNGLLRSKAFVVAR